MFFSFLISLLLAEYVPSVQARIGDSGSYNMGDMDPAKMLEMFMSGKDMNYTDIYDRCCSSGDESKPSQYDLNATACKCPVREDESKKEIWEEKCVSKLKPNAEAEMRGEEPPVSKDFNMTKLMQIFMYSMTANYTDIYDRCCSSGDESDPSSYDLDPTSCKCPVRTNATYVAKWDDKCTNLIAYKAEAEMSGNKYDYGLNYTYDYNANDTSSFDFEALFEMMTGKEVNYTDVYDRCCSSGDEISPSQYDLNATACSCPVRNSEKYVAKWDDKCVTKIGPKAEEEMTLASSP